MVAGKVINLHKYNGYQIGDGVPVFAGREKAAFYWEQNGIEPGDDFTLIVPEDVICLVGTFLCSLVCRAGTVTVQGNEYWAERVAELKGDHARRRLHDGLPLRLF